MKIQFFASLLCITACHAPIENCNKNTWFNNHPIVQMTGGRNEQHGYLYCYPSHFDAPQNAHLLQNDTLTAHSKEDDIQIQYYIGNIIPHKTCPETSTEHQKIVVKLDSLLDLAQKNANAALNGATIQHTCHDKEDLSLFVWAQTSTDIVLYGIMLAEIPKEGDLREAFMLMRCPKIHFKKYESVLAAMSNNFSRFF